MHRKILTYSTRGKSEIRTITGDLRRCVAESGIRNGCLLAYSLHTTLGLMVQETEESHLCEDVLDYLGFVIEEDGELYKHRGHLHPRSHGDDTDCNAPSHLRQILVNQNVLLDIHDGELALGPWQDVAIAEFDGPRAGRNVLVKVWPDPAEETVDDRRQTTDHRRRTTDDRPQTTDDRRQTTDDRRPSTRHTDGRFPAESRRSVASGSRSVVCRPTSVVRRPSSIVCSPSSATAERKR